MKRRRESARSQEELRRRPTRDIARAVQVLNKVRNGAWRPRVEQRSVLYRSFNVKKPTGESHRLPMFVFCKESEDGTDIYIILIYSRMLSIGYQPSQKAKDYLYNLQFLLSSSQELNMTEIEKLKKEIEDLKLIIESKNNQVESKNKHIKRLERIISNMKKEQSQQQPRGRSAPELT